MIYIKGNIGAGKTTLLNMIKENNENIHILHEPVE